MTSPILSFLLLLSVCILCRGNPTPDDGGPIKSGVKWYDTSNNEIHAHGGGIYYNDSTGIYYWIGTSQKLPPDALSSEITCYSSYDLTTWKYEGAILKNTSIKVDNAKGPWRIERPKVVYNNNNNNPNFKKYVLWFHLDTAGFSLRNVGVAISDTICGQYTWVHGFKPDGQDSYDMGLFQDDDGSAYLIRSVMNSYAGISKLTPDFLNTTGIISRGPRVEGQCVFKYKENYYLWGSHLTGWDPNQAVLAISPSLNGTWKLLTPPTTDSTTFHSQSTFILPYRHAVSKNLLFIYMADRWNSPNVAGATYVWLPIKINSPENVVLDWYDSWQVRDFNSTPFCEESCMCK